MKVDWKYVGKEIWNLIDPREGYKRGEWLGRVIRQRGPAIIKQVRERFEL